MLEITQEELKKILPKDGPTIDEVKRYLEKYNDEYIVIKCGGSVLVDQNLFNIFISDIAILNKLGFIPMSAKTPEEKSKIKLLESFALYKFHKTQGLYPICNTEKPKKEDIKFFQSFEKL